MKRVVFVISHLRSGSFDLIDILNQNPRIDIRGVGARYNRALDLHNLFALGHKLDNVSAIYGDHLLYNITFYCKDFYTRYPFIYLIREARPTINEILDHPKSVYTPETATNYYLFRLRRMCEMAKRTKTGVLLTWQNLADGVGLDAVSEMLDLPEPIIPQPKLFKSETPDMLPRELALKAEEGYERYYHYLRNQNLILPQK